MQDDGYEYGNLVFLERLKHGGLRRRHVHILIVEFRILKSCLSTSTIT